MCYKWTVKSFLTHVAGHTAHQPHPFPSYSQSWGTLDSENVKLFGRAEDCLQFACVERITTADFVIWASFNGCVGMRGRIVLWEHSMFYNVQSFSFFPSFYVESLLLQMYEVKIKKDR